MAATVSSVWAKPGAWALDSEEHEEELKREIEQPKSFQPPEPEFPSLSAAAAAKPKKKNKGQTLSWADFANYSSAPKSGAFQPKRLTQDELISLPTGPRERTAEELDGTRLGGGFRNYGGDSSRVRVSDRNREGGFDGNSNRDRDLGPSRADEVDDWSKMKKFGSFGGGSGSGPDRSERRERGVGFFNSSRADEVDNWASTKSFAPPPSEPRRERRMGFESYSNGSGPDADTWGRKREERAVDADTWGRKREERAVDSDTWGRKREERAADSENWGRKKEEERETSNANGVGRPKLNLQPRTMPINNVTPTEGGGKTKGSNPFGEARPREEVLAEKGKDWKEIDEKLEAVKIKEEKGEAFGRRKGFGVSRVDSGDEKTIKSWRKPESNDAVSPPAPSEEKTEDNAEVTENSDSIEKDPEEN